MDRKKKAQAAWAVLLALLGLLFIPSLPGGNTGGSESPAQDPAGEESGQENQQGSEDGAEDGTQDGAEDGAEEGTGDGAEDGWSVEDGEDDQAGQDDDPLQEPSWGEDDTTDPDGTSGDDGPVEDRQDQFPDENEENAEQNEELFPPDATEGETTYGGEDDLTIPENPTTSDLEDLASELPDATSGALDVGAANQAFHADGTGLFEWARKNPGKAALIVGGAAVFPASQAYVLAGGSTLALSASQAASLAAVGVPASTYENANDRLKNALAEDVDGLSGTGDTTEPSGGQDTIEGSHGTQQDGAVEERDESDPWSEDDQETIEEDEEAGTVPSGTDNPFNDDYDDEDEDTSSGRGGPDGGEGDHTPDIDPIDIPDELDDDQDDDSDDSSSDSWDDGGDDAVEEDEDAGTVPSGTDNPFNDYDDSDDGSTEEPADAVDDDPADTWMPGTGGHTPGVI